MHVDMDTDTNQFAPLSFACETIRIYEYVLDLNYAEVCIIHLALCIATTNIMPIINPNITRLVKRLAIAIIKFSRVIAGS